VRTSFVPSVLATDRRLRNWSGWSLPGPPKDQRRRQATGRFTNKIVLITGGTSGIGLAAARQFIEEGAKVVVTGRSKQSIGHAQKELGKNGIAIAADVTKSADLDALFQQVREKYGRIDVLYANAGIAKLGSVAETTE
jgi:NAD(P)-dependent dehydrogenase (short-subunit alcohol dehydrogenase family)